MDEELLNFYFKKFNEWEHADDERKRELLPDLEALGNCVSTMFKNGG